MGNSQTNEDSVGGKNLIPAAGLIKNWLFWSIEEAERLKGSAPNTPEVTVVFHRHYTRQIVNGYLNAFI